MLSHHATNCAFLPPRRTTPSHHAILPRRPTTPPTPASHRAVGPQLVGEARAEILMKVHGLTSAFGRQHTENGNLDGDYRSLKTASSMKWQLKTLLPWLVKNYGNHSLTGSRLADFLLDVEGKTLPYLQNWYTAAANMPSSLSPGCSLDTLKQHTRSGRTPMILLTDENTGNEVCKSFMTSTTEVGSNGTQTRVLLLVDTSAEGWMLEFQKECVSRTSIADDLLAALVDQELLRLRVPPDVDWPGQHTLRTRTFETTVPPPSHPHPLTCICAPSRSPSYTAGPLSG